MSGVSPKEKGTDIFAFPDLAVPEWTILEENDFKRGARQSAQNHVPSDEDQAIKLRRT
jgi:hypothetical protein